MHSAPVAQAPNMQEPVRKRPEWSAAMARKLQMVRKSNIEALVVGAGPVGLMMALQLNRYGIPCRLVDRAAQRTDQSRALAVWSRTLEMLEPLGLADRLVATGIRGRGVAVHNQSRRLFEIDLSGLPSRFNFTLLVPQSETERILEEGLQARGLAIERQTACAEVSVRRDGADVVLQGPDDLREEVACRWLIACDGAHSIIRHALAAPFEGRALETVLALADVTVAGPVSKDQLSIYWTRGGMVAFFPIAPPLYRVVVDTPLGDPGTPPTLAHFQQLLLERGLSQLTISDPRWTSNFRVHERKVASYRYGPVFLAGDAAHVHSPAGGQGMNTGLQDACNLGWKLAQAIRTPACAENLLDSYSLERGHVGRQVLQASGFMTAMTTLREPWEQALRNAAAQVVMRTRIRRKAVLQLSELSVNYRKIAPNRMSLGLICKVRAGDRVPDVSMPVGRLHEFLWQAPFTLLAFAGTDGGALHTLEALIPDLGSEVQCYAVGTDATVPQVPLLEDRSGAIHKAFGLEAGGLVLVRPDGYAGVVARADERPAVLKEWMRAFGIQA